MDGLPENPDFISVSLWASAGRFRMKNKITFFSPFFFFSNLTNLLTNTSKALLCVFHSEQVGAKKNKQLFSGLSAVVLVIVDSLKLPL